VKVWPWLAILTVVGCGAEPSELVPSEWITDDAINHPLTEEAGLPARGEALFRTREQGHCVLCHRVSGLDAEFQGNIGPDLSHVGDRLSAAQLRLRIVDYQRVRPGALMPSYYRNHDLYQVDDAYAGKSILSAQDVEDIVAYLGELKRNEDDA
jgi:sulfur-oxidizing protein SoxX